MKLSGPVLVTGVENASEVLREGGVIAYPTEYCFGLGCDPGNSQAVQRILKIKGRESHQGLIVLASSYAQVNSVADLPKAQQQDEIRSSWPGPVTWLLPPRPGLAPEVLGRHSTLAVRMSAHPLCIRLCDEFGGAIVSTSANRHANPPLMSAESVSAEMGDELDLILDGPLGGASGPSQIRDGATGVKLR